MGRAASRRSGPHSPIAARGCRRPVQVLGELFDVLVRKGGKSRSDARDALLRWRDTFPVFRPIKVAAQDICGSKTAS